MANPNIARKGSARQAAEDFRHFYSRLLETNPVARGLYARSPSHVDVLIEQGIFRFPGSRLPLKTIKNYRLGQIGGRKALPALPLPEGVKALPAQRPVAAVRPSEAAMRPVPEQSVVDEAVKVRRRHSYLGDWDLAKNVARHLGVDADLAYEIVCARKKEIEEMSRKKH
jgi:hypothetical protein